MCTKVATRAAYFPGDVAQATQPPLLNAGQTCFRLQWCERNGPKVLAPSHRGFGHVVLKRVTGEALQGKANHEFEARGVSWTLEAPLSAIGTLRPNER